MDILMTNETILTGDEYYECLIQDIQHAESSIDMETYIYTEDAFGKRIAKQLSDAAQRGVKVRLLIDGAGTSFIPDCVKQIEKQNVQVRVYHPIAWSSWQWRQANVRMTIWKKILFLLSKINRRNHRKTCVIDNRIAYIGSANISVCHLSSELGGENWQDVIVRLENINTKELNFAFDVAWKGFPIDQRFKKFFQRTNLNPLFRLNYTRRKRKVLYRSLLRKLSQAKTRIWVTSAYFNPNYFLLSRLIKAAKRGVDVKVILQNKTDVKIMPLVARTFYVKMLRAGIKVYEYSPSILHSKMLIIDDWFCVGSSNLNYRSLRHDLEIDVNIQNEETKEKITALFLDNLKHSDRISIEAINNQSWYQKLLGQILLYGRYFL